MLIVFLRHPSFIYFVYYFLSLLIWLILLCACVYSLFLPSSFHFSQILSTSLMHFLPPCSLHSSSLSCLLHYLLLFSVLSLSLNPSHRVPLSNKIVFLPRFLFHILSSLLQEFQGTYVFRNKKQEIFRIKRARKLKKDFSDLKPPWEPRKERTSCSGVCFLLST